MNVTTDHPRIHPRENPTASLQADRDRLLLMGRDDRERQGQTYAHGRLLVDVFARGLWTLDEGGPYPATRKDFVGWARRVSGTPGSESTLLRRMDLAVAFSRAAFDELLGQGRSVSALMEIAGAPAPYRQKLLDLGKECTVEDLREARKELTRILRAQAEAADPELVAAKLTLAAARSRAERARRRVGGGLCAECGERLSEACGAGAGGAGAGGAGASGVGAGEVGAGGAGASGAGAGEVGAGVRAEGANAAEVTTVAAGLAGGAGAATPEGGRATGSAGAGAGASAETDPRLAAEMARLAAERDIMLAKLAAQETELAAIKAAQAAAAAERDSKLESADGAGAVTAAERDSKLESADGAGAVTAAERDSKLESADGAGAAAAAERDSKLESAAGVVAAAGGAAAGATAEGWWVPMTRALTADLSAEQTTELERQLVLALAGTAPAALAGLLRELAARPPGLSPSLQADFAEWLRGALDRDLAARWSYLYCFFTTAQLPGYIGHLHLLRGVNLPEAAATEVKLGCTACPLTDEPPLDIPEDADDLTARAIVLAHELAQVARESDAFLANDSGCTVATLGRLWCVAADLTDDLAGLEVDLAGLIPVH